MPLKDSKARFNFLRSPVIHEDPAEPEGSSTARSTLMTQDTEESGLHLSTEEARAAQGQKWANATEGRPYFSHSPSKEYFIYLFGLAGPWLWHMDQGRSGR